MEPARAAPPAPLPLEIAWSRVLAALGEAERVQVHDVAFPIGLVDGTFKVGVKRELWVRRVRDQLAQVDLAERVPGARRVDVVFAPETGTTGREALAAVDIERRAAARAAAEASEPLKRLMAIFDAELEEVHPYVPRGAHDVPLVVEDVPEE